MITVTEKVLEEMVAAIVQEIDPEQIYLFGSHARGEARPASQALYSVCEMPCSTPRNRNLSLGVLGHRMSGDDVLEHPIIHDGVRHVIEHAVDLPSRHVQAYHPCVTMCPWVSWEAHGDHGMHDRGDDVCTVYRSETSASIGEDFSPWHPNAAKKSRNGRKPSSVGGSDRQAHAAL